MRTSRSWTLAPLVLALLAGCERDGGEVAEDVEPAPMVRPEVAPGDAGMQTPYGYELMAMSRFEPGAGAAPGQSVGGVARVLVPERTADHFLLQVRVSGLAEGAHAWHIHSGPCGKEAPVVVPLTRTASQQGIAEPLTTGADGAAEQTVSVPGPALSLAQLSDGEYSVQVHAGAGVDPGPTVACAAL